VTPVPYGAAKSIISSMADWEHRIVRPEHAPTFFRTASTMRVSINLRHFTRRGEHLFVMRRLPTFKHPLRSNAGKPDIVQQIIPA
jgi:hypothetical protein